MTEHLAAHVLGRAAMHPEDLAVRSGSPDDWTELTYGDVAAQVRHVCHGLIAAGLHPGDAVAIISDNRAEWIVAELAITAASGVVLHLGPASPVEELATILRETEARVAFVSGEVLTQRLAPLTGRLPSLRVVFVFDEGPEVTPHLDELSVLTLGVVVDDLGAEVGTHGTFSWQRLMTIPFDIATAAEAQRRRDAWGPDDIAFIDYTISGAGELRGVVMTHRGTVVTVRAIAEAFGVAGRLHEVATLPLHHSLQHGSSLLALMSGGSVTLVRDREDIGRALRELRPSLLMTTMPVLRTLVQDALRRIADTSVLGQGVVQWGRDVATRDGLRRADPRPRGAVDIMRSAAARAGVGRALAAELGGPKEVFVVAGTGAPPELFHLLELAGFTACRSWSTLETGVLAATNTPRATRAGSVGRPLSSLEVAIDADGEVLLRGPGIMRGYFGLPTETLKVLREGWLHTGQIGRLDDQGYLHLTSRLDDMIVTDSLHYVAPHLVESRLRAVPLVEDVVIVGDGRPFLAAIVHPDLEVAREIAAAGGATTTDPEEIVSDPMVVRAVGDAVREAGASLAHDQQVHAFRLSATPLDVLGGSAATSAYVRRQRLERECAAAIEEIYGASHDPRQA